MNYDVDFSLRDRRFSTLGFHVKSSFSKIKIFIPSIVLVSSNVRPYRVCARDVIKFSNPKLKSP